MDNYYIIKKPGEGEYEDRKSRFIGHAFPISNETEALALIDQVKRKYWDARHNCYAYITGDNGDILRFSDDGEPGGTAGRPILDVLTGAELRNVLIVVTRYFGGTLLGTGGLVRAYSAATKEALADAVICQMVSASKIAISIDYTGWGKLQYYLAQNNISIEDTNYSDKVEVIIYIEADRVGQSLDEITGLSNGKSEITVIDTGYYAL